MESDHVEVAARHMKAQQIRRLAVLDANRRIVGVLSIGDIARVTEDRDLTGSIESAVAEDTVPA